MFDLGLQRKARDTWQEDVSPSALENDLLCDEDSLSELSEVTTHTLCAREHWITVHDSPSLQLSHRPCLFVALFFSLFLSLMFILLLFCVLLQVFLWQLLGCWLFVFVFGSLPNTNQMDLC